MMVDVVARSQRRKSEWKGGGARHGDCGDVKRKEARVGTPLLSPFTPPRVSRPLSSSSSKVSMSELPLQQLSAASAALVGAAAKARRAAAAAKAEAEGAAGRE